MFPATRHLWLATPSSCSPPVIAWTI